MTTQSLPTLTQVPVEALPFSDAQRCWYEAAVAELDIDRMTEFCIGLVSIHSPTGRERAASEWLAAQMTSLGLDAHYQPIDELSGNAYGYYHGSADGPTLMLYAPIDTHLDADEDGDIPWVAPSLRPDMLPQGCTDGNHTVFGLGAHNPKGFATIVWGAMDALTRAQTPLRGNVVAAFGSGGMPILPPPSHTHLRAGIGSGASYLINHGVTADFALLAKGGNSVRWEEVGLCWFKVTVRGAMIYAGTPHTSRGYRNTPADAAKVILAFQDWFLEYNKRNTSGQCSPWGHIAAVRGGWPHRPAFATAAVELYIDLRVNPRTTTAQVQHQFGEGVRAIKERFPDIDLDWEMFGSYPGARTDPENWIIQSGMRGWEHVHGKPHRADTGLSGQTDASAIRNLGIPLARIGPPVSPLKLPESWGPGMGGMGAVHIPDLAQAVRIYLYAIIDTCTRSRADVGLVG